MVVVVAVVGGGLLLLAGGERQPQHFARRRRAISEAEPSSPMRAPQPPARSSRPWELRPKQMAPVPAMRFAVPVRVIELVDVSIV